MIQYLGDFTTSHTVYVYFNTFSSDDPSVSVTMTGLLTSDIEIYKNGSATTRSSDSGYTLLDTDGIDFASHTGVHGFSIDLSDNTDAGFFAAGAEYLVVVDAITVDGGTLSVAVATFSIGRSGNVATILTDTEAILTDSEAVLTDTEANTAVLTDTEAILTDSEAILADTNELQTDWVDAGRLDAILDAVLVDTEANTAVITDTEAILTDSEAIKAKTDSLTFTVAGDVDANVQALNDVTASAVNLERSASTIETGTVDSTENVPTTTAFDCDDITEATADHFNGRIIIFTSGALQFQATDITDYALTAGGRGRFTVTALTEAPANNVTLVIV